MCGRNKLSLPWRWRLQEDELVVARVEADGGELLDAGRGGIAGGGDLSQRRRPGRVEFKGDPDARITPLFGEGQLFG